jgi:hypothetical protein
MRETSRAGVVVRLCATAAFLITGAARAGATPILLTVVSGPLEQQAANRPCIIGDPSCHNPEGLPFTLLDPHTGKGTVSSPTYTVGQLRELLGGDMFSVGLDLNQARGHDGGAYTLRAFTLAVDGITRYASSGPTTLVPINFGNGFSDASIAMFDLSGLSDAQQLVFTASFSGATAGREQFFLSPQENGLAPIPEPGTMLLFGSGLAALIAERRRRATSRQR